MLCHKRPTNAILFSTAFLLFTSQLVLMAPFASTLARIARESSPGSAKMSLVVVVMTHLPILQGDAPARPEPEGRPWLIPPPKPQLSVRCAPNSLTSGIVRFSCPLNQPE